ncbi:hypothetical protein PUN28_008102 [Cardiocondyla obscurior]|uniref:Uncharacterized protein n=1 Tax=Cardiocondyla obscurior TaxID=286306 RepID=A0AAW2FXP6_9HYME
MTSCELVLPQKREKKKRNKKEKKKQFLTSLHYCMSNVFITQVDEGANTEVDRGKEYEKGKIRTRWR